jgi:hypothetical protein
MKFNDAGDFCMLYIEPADEKPALLEFISGQKKPVVIMLPVQSRSTIERSLFQRPDDFGDLKHVKRKLDLPIIFVIPGNERLRQLASRNGFPAYISIDALSDSLAQGHLSLSRQRTLTRKTTPLSSPPVPEQGIAARRTIPLAPTPPSFQQSAAPTPPALLQTIPKTTSSPQHAPVTGKRRRRLPVVLFLVSLLLVGAAGATAYLWYFRILPPAAASLPQPKVVGQISLLSSEQLSENSDQGIDDEVQIDLHGLSTPSPGKSYYAWLLGDKNQGEARAVLLGRLAVNQGNAYLLYPGDQQHTNLLASNSRFLVTEEGATVTPITPSPDYSTWRYYGEFPQTPDPLDSHHFSFLDHLRHLLAADPLLDEMELPGGLSNWLYRNTGKLLEWTGSARDRWEEAKDLAFVRRQTLRTLSYLDGLAFVHQDLPAGATLPEISRLEAVGLIDVNGANQVPPGYLGHIVYHLTGLVEAPGSTPDTRKSAAAIIAAMNNVQLWLEKLRTDAKQIVAMTDYQLAQPAAFDLLNDMVDQANHAYVGDINPATGEMLQGVTWIHNQLQTLATLTVTQYIAGVSPPEIVPNPNNAIAFSTASEVKNK